HDAVAGLARLGARLPGQEERDLPPARRVGRTGERGPVAGRAWIRALGVDATSWDRGLLAQISSAHEASAGEAAPRGPPVLRIGRRPRVPRRRAPSPRLVHRTLARRDL